jgi:TolB-like protein
MTFAPGTRLGPYEIQDLIGAGGMGEVYRALDTRLDRVVAIKTLTAGQGDRFRQEARAIAALNHPHICVLHDVGPDYLVMEFLDGAPPQGPMPLDDVLRIGQQVASALAAAHGKGVLHRDLKPANISITRSGAKLLDFGLATLTGTSAAADATRTGSGLVMGTAAYMSPEQARGLPADTRSDIFSFGVVLYELIAGRRPFTGPSMVETMNAVIKDEPAAFESPLWPIVKRCLAKDPSQRFQSMIDLQSALQHARGEGAAPARDTHSRPSIAVLPFANLSLDPSDEYFSDGLAEEIITALGQVPGLKVIARSSAFAFKGKLQDVRQIAAELGVGTVLEGSVRRAGNRVRVTVQLVLASDGSQLWSQRFDREMADIFEMQDEISSAIAGTLKLKLTAAAERRTPSIPAYEAYLKYRFYQWQFTPEAAQRSRECLEQALALDSGFALPYVGLADYHLAKATVGAMRASEAMPPARGLAQRALELDPDLPEAHAMLGIVAGHYDFDWAEQERCFARAFARGAVSGHVRQQRALFDLLTRGRAEEAHREHLKVIDDDPLCQMWHYTRSLTLAALGRDADALAAAERAAAIDPASWLGWREMGIIHATNGRPGEALACAERVMAMAPWSPPNVGLVAGALEAVGHADRARPHVDALRADADNGAAGLFIYHLVCGDVDTAVGWAQRACEQRYTAFIPLTVRPRQGLLRASPRWRGFLESVRLDDSLLADSPSANRGVGRLHNWSGNPHGSRSMSSRDPSGIARSSTNVAPTATSAARAASGSAAAKAIWKRSGFIAA